jgi:hypothetical protein
VKLRAQAIVINAPRALCFEVVAVAGRRLEKRSDDQWIVEFKTETGGRSVRTVELLDETISFTEIDEKTTRLTIAEVSRPAGALLGW